MADHINPPQYGKGEDEKTVPPTTDLHVMPDATDAAIGYGTVYNADGNLEYSEDTNEPEIHARTWIIVIAMSLLQYVQLVALQGPPAVLSYMAKDLGNTEAQNWIPSALSLSQAVIGPSMCLASDMFQARKLLIIAASVISFVGAAIVPGANDIYRVIAGQALIGVGLASSALCFTIPSEILPRKWRPMAQAIINVFASFGSISAPLIAAAWVRDNPRHGWRDFYWLQVGLWGATAVLIFFCYTPPKRHTRYDHLSFWQKLSKVDIPGSALFASGLTLFLVGMNLGANMFPWTDVRTLSTLIIGLVTLVAFAIYEWKGTKIGMLNHDMFRGGLGGDGKSTTFVLCLALIFVEGAYLYAYIIFYPVVSLTLFYNADPLLSAARTQPFWIACLVSTVIFGWLSTKLRAIRELIAVGFIILAGSAIGMATLEPGQSINQLAFAGLAGVGFGSPLILIVTAIQYAVPHSLMATATALTNSSRAVAGTTFIAIYGAALSSETASKIPQYITKAAVAAGLPASSIPAFITALSSSDFDALYKIQGVTPTIVQQGSGALEQAYADSLRVIFIIVAPLGVVACVASFFMANMRNTMNYHVDAPAEELHSKHKTTEAT